MIIGRLITSEIIIVGLPRLEIDVRVAALQKFGGHRSLSIFQMDVLVPTSEIDFLLWTFWRVLYGQLFRVRNLSMCK